MSIILTTKMNNQLLDEKLLELCNKIYSPPQKPMGYSRLRNKSPDSIFDFMYSNRLAHYFAIENRQTLINNPEFKKTCDRLMAEYDEYKNKLKSAIYLVKSFLKNKPFVIIKTFSIFPHTTSDVDVLVRDLNTAKNLQDMLSRLSNNEEQIAIDVSERISWSSTDIVGNDFVWGNLQNFNFEGCDFFVPNAALDTLIRLAHIPFELAHIKLGELLHIYRRGLTFNWEILENEAKNRGWRGTFMKMERLLNLLHYNLFGAGFLSNYMNKSFPEKNIKFPFNIPLSILAGAVIEKKAWKKFWGARFIIKDRMLG